MPIFHFLSFLHPFFQWVRPTVPPMARCFPTRFLQHCCFAYESMPVAITGPHLIIGNFILSHLFWGSPSILNTSSSFISSFHYHPLHETNLVTHGSTYFIICNFYSCCFRNNQFVKDFLIHKFLRLSYKLLLKHTPKRHGDLIH